jgi:hypothetical protein
MKRLIMILLAGSTLLFVISSANASNIITFDEFPLGTLIDTEYASLGVIFHEGDLTPRLPQISNNGAMVTMPVLRATGEPDFYIFQGDFWIEFAPPALEVEFISGYWDAIGNGIIDVYDPAMYLLTSLTNTGTGVETTNLSGMGPIGYIYFNSIADGAGADIDNLIIQPALVVDIKPTSCPNPLNVKSKGVLPVAILGAEGFDVSDVDVTTLFLEGVAPVKIAYDDVAAPIVWDGDECECTEAGSDGYIDLVLHFDTQEIVAVLGSVADGDVLPLTLVGLLVDGTPTEGYDCIRIIKKGNN